MSHDHDEHSPSSLSRRDFLRLAGASVALAGLDGCSRMPAEHILPFVDNRPELTPGVGAYYATAMSIDGCVTGLIVESHDGRPTKIEGNPAHPASLGATGALEQASVLQLYDPDRARYARSGTSRTTWAAIAAQLAPSVLGSRVGARGAGLHILIEPTSSLLDEELLVAILEAHPDARIYMYAPLVTDRSTQPLVQHYDVSAADVILAVDSDFLASGPFHLRYARQFADGRRLTQPSDAMNRLYAIESTFTPTGAAADHRFTVRPREIANVLRAIAQSVSANTGGLASAPAWAAAIARDLHAHAGRSVVISHDPSPEIRGLVRSINDAIGATGKTTWYTASPLIGSHVPLRPFSELIDAMHARAVDTLVIAGGNPSYATPAIMDFSSLLAAVPNSVYVGMYENETARGAKSFVPMSHYLEAWADGRAYDGTVSLVQPLVNPLYHSISPAELYAALGGKGVATSYDLLRASWARRTAGDAESAWARTLESGVVDGSAYSRTVTPPEPIAAAPPTSSAAANGIDVRFCADHKTHDGAYSNNGWLQELPAPITQLTWGNAALLSPRTAQRLGIADGGPVSLSASGRTLELPAHVVPGLADETVTVHFGYGRAGAESLARGVGASAYALWPALGVRYESGVSIAAAGSAGPLSIAQTQSTMQVNEPVRRASLDQYRASPTSVAPRPNRVLSLYPAQPASRHAPEQWAMTIDLSTCIGCGACVVACQAENNIPVVGAEEVRKGRAMQWLRIDRYFASREAEIEALVQPMLCQHCEHAPCEYVCPVEATTHSSDGLNEMVYNRCVGTRFCSNNCPYKVRHFNWFDYNAHLSETEMMVKNPNVTVRERGVMEKCTFCVQRIREAEIAAGRDGRPMRGTDVRTACQQACPTNAIVFGSLSESDSEVVRRREQPRAYAALEDLGTEPRVKYLARIRNTNPDVSSGEAK
ncbi:MAG TPA: 4Fe-4S dicluster domain-containing protein [Gemmatimonadaceae bacterium]|nr:4Fe-4S dicluster domain-containing protein [Gemmatimonadaceae bacterium]